MTSGQAANVVIAIGGGSNSKTIKIGGQSPPGSPLATYFTGYLLH